MKCFIDHYYDGYDDKLPDTIEPGEVLQYAEKYMKPEEIDHHGNGHGLDDLYLKVTKTSMAIINRLTTTSLLSRFNSNIDGTVWYDLPFCYNKVTDKYR